MLLEKISTFECLVSNHKIYKGLKIQRERFLDPQTSYHGQWEGNMEELSSYGHWYRYLKCEIQEDFPHCHHIHQFLLPCQPPLILLLAKLDGDVAVTIAHDQMGEFGAGEEIF